jgi:hypothetical protein
MATPYITVIANPVRKSGRGKMVCLAGGTFKIATTRLNSEEIRRDGATISFEYFAH